MTVIDSLISSGYEGLVFNTKEVLKDSFNETLQAIHSLGTSALSSLANTKDLVVNSKVFQDSLVNLPKTLDAQVTTEENDTYLSGLFDPESTAYWNGIALYSAEAVRIVYRAIGIGSEPKELSRKEKANLAASVSGALLSAWAYSSERVFPTL